MRQRATFLEQIRGTFAKHPNLAHLCEYMLTRDLPDMRIWGVAPVVLARSYGENSPSLTYRICPAEHPSTTGTYVDLIIKDYGFWVLALMWHSRSEEESCLLEMAAGALRDPIPNGAFATAAS